MIGMLRLLSSVSSSVCVLCVVAALLSTADYAAACSCNYTPSAPNCGSNCGACTASGVACPTATGLTCPAGCMCMSKGLGFSCQRPSK